MQIAVAGVTFEGRQKVLMNLYYNASERDVVLRGRLEREPLNPHDPNAIKVLVRYPFDPYWHHVGYVPRALAEDLAFRLSAGEEASVSSVRILEGKVGPVIYGVRIIVEMRPKGSVQVEG